MENPDNFKSFKKPMTDLVRHKSFRNYFSDFLETSDPSLAVQQKLVKEIEILEVQIAGLQNVIDDEAAPSRSTSGRLR
jgi:hypothetical protein